MHLAAGVRYSSFSLIFGGQSALTFGQVAIHQAISILFEIGIVETQCVTHLVHDRRKQINATRRRARRFSAVTTVAASADRGAVGTLPLWDADRAQEKAATVLPAHRPAGHDAMSGGLASAPSVLRSSVLQ